MSQILVVDDSDLERTELVKALSKHGFDVVSATNGRKAIPVLQNHPDLKLIIADLLMPEMTGVEFIEYVRNTLKNQQIKVIISYSETSSSVRSDCKKLNIHGWMLKPVRIDVTLKVLSKIIGSP